jgi:hypothetical protein
MENEIFDIVNVKNEYITAVGQSMTQQFNIQALEAGFVILNDFCNNIRSNNLVLVRVPREVEQPIGPERISREPVAEMDDETLRREYEKRMKANDMRQKVNDLNKNLEEDMRSFPKSAGFGNLNPMPQVPRMEETLNPNVDLRQEKPKNFIQKVKSYKTDAVNINDEDEEY